jgi:hypothetical protein
MKRRACIVVASEMTVRAFLRRQIAAMQEEYDVTVVVNAPTPGLEQELGVGVRVQPLPIEREVSPVRDLLCLLALVRLLRVHRFDLVHSMTPKAGLLAMSAAWIARVGVRVHTFTGQVWATRSGFQRIGLKLVDRLIAGAATFTLADSPSQRAFLTAQGVARRPRSRYSATARSAASTPGGSGRMPPFGVTSARRSASPKRPRCCCS